MISFGEQVDRLRQRQMFAARMHTRFDILSPHAKDQKLLEALVAELDPVLDYQPTTPGLHRCPLPYGLRSVRYSLSPVVQNAIESDGRAKGMFVRQMPTTLDETIAFIAHGCPVAEANWPELRRLIYVDPEVLAGMIYPFLKTDAALFRLILSREYRLALSRYPILADTPPNSLGFTGRMIDLCVTFGEMERCDSLGMGLAAQKVDVKSVKYTLLDQKRMVAAMSEHTPEGEYLFGLLVNPDLLPKASRGKRPWYGPWNSPDPLAYDPIKDFADPDRYAAFVDDVLDLPIFQKVGKGSRIINANLSTYWGANLSQLAEITFLAAGDTVHMHRGPGVDLEMKSPKDPRVEAIRILADGFRERHDPKFRKEIAAKRKVMAEKLRKADMEARAPWERNEPPISPEVKLVTVGASRIQQNHDRASLLAPQAGMPGHASAIDGKMWLHPRADRALWQALCETPPSRTWLDKKGVDAAAKRAFEAIRAVRNSVPQLFHRRKKGDARLLADLATTTGWLSGQPQFTARVKDLVEQSAELRGSGWLASRLHGRMGGGGDPSSRNCRNANKIPHADEVIRATDSRSEPDA